MKKINTEIEIAAPPEAVWGVLADFAAYPEWNPFMCSVSGEAVVGSRLVARMQPTEGKAMTFRPTVTAVEPEQHLEWVGRLGLPRLFDGRHRFTIERTSGGTKFIHSEEFTGLLVPLLWQRIVDGTRGGFEAMNQALQTRVEASIS